MTRPAPTAAALAVLTLTVLAAWLVATIAPGGPEALRDQLRFTFTPAPAHLSGATRLAANNLGVCILGPLGACAQLLYTSPLARMVARVIFDVVLTVVFVTNAAQFGVALAAYGTQLLAWTPHVPLELVALALAAGAYLRSRHDHLTPRQLAAAAALIAIIVTTSAAIETWAVPHT